MVEYRTLEWPDVEDGNPNQQLIEQNLQMFMPLFGEYWERKGRKVYNQPFDMDVFTLIRGCVYAGLRIVIATEKDLPVGFMLVNRYRAISHACNMCFLEKWYGRTDEIEKGFFDYIGQRKADWGVTQFIVPEIPGSALGDLPGRREDMNYRWYRT